MTVARLIGTTLYWLAWPAYQVYFRFGDRTRVVIVQQGKILAMQQWIGTGRWSLPGGGLHRHEEPLIGALREVREETGLQLVPGQLQYLGRHAYRQHGHHFYFHAYVCELNDLPELHRQWYEVAALTWLPPASFTRADAAQDAVMCVQLAATHIRLVQ